MWSLQPFVAVGLKLKEHGHRVRIATHAQLRPFVEQFGLEFYPLGGDPQILAEFAVQSKGAQKHVLAAICTHLYAVLWQDVINSAIPHADMLSSMAMITDTYS